MTFNDPLIETIKNLLDSSFNGSLVTDEEIVNIIEQSNGAGVPNWFNLGIWVKSGMFRTQVLKKWDNGQKTESEKVLLEKQVDEFVIGARKALTEWNDYKNKVK